jgi:hypothetical protein
VLVTEQNAATYAAFQTHARTKGASNLMVPADVIVVAKLPLLGSGEPTSRPSRALLSSASPPPLNSTHTTLGMCRTRTGIGVDTYRPLDVSPEFARMTG